MLDLSMLRQRALTLTSSRGAKSPSPEWETDRHQTTISVLIRTLLERNHINETTLDRARPAAAESGERVDRVLAKLGLVSEEALTEAWAQVMGLLILLPKDYPDHPPTLDHISSEFWSYSQTLPVSVVGTTLTLAVADPLDTFSPAAVMAKTRMEVRIVLARPGELKAAVTRLYTHGQTHGNDNGISDALIGDIEQLRDLASDAPVIRAVNDIIDHAIEVHASDVHLTATDIGTRVKVRVDGLLIEQPAALTSVHAAIISRLKIMSGLDIAERRLPQDGRIQMNWRGRKIDLRVATMPHIQGEGVVLRVLDRGTNILALDTLGLDPALLKSIRRLLAEPHGLFIVTGPTGSGKTTTLYAALAELARSDRNVITVEDPVEYHMSGINQIQVNRKIGLDFSTALRSALRQDPDVIMVGEIRDSETASIANQAALTGHLVLATVHTNTAAAAVPRLINMGVEPYLLASTLRGAMAQRLVRRLCPHCRKSRSEVPASAPPSGSLVNSSVAASDLGFEPGGCQECHQTGYTGRLMISELMLVDEAVQVEISRASDEASISRAAKERSAGSLEDDGMRKVRAGQTSLAEVLRVLGGS